MIHPIFPFFVSDARPVDLSDPALDPRDHVRLAAHVNAARADAPAAWGGYGERRELYTGSDLFTGTEPRIIHLGIDVWTDPGTPLAAPLAATVHSFADNAAFGDYGATIILDHGGFHVLYGHLARRSLDGLEVGSTVAAGKVFAWVGDRHENGGWPPHLHLQKILRMGDFRGDFPGTATEADRDIWFNRCPDPTDLFV
ncbi:MAG: peptidoglycan DD-metalloendopeptidase family protein [bacterium]|nr:peptidoglycan DD-metalloendopeptidase family protein [bacterium]